LFSKNIHVMKCPKAKGDKETEMDCSSYSKSTKHLPEIKISSKHTAMIFPPTIHTASLTKSSSEGNIEIISPVNYKYYFTSFDSPFMNVNSAMGTDDHDLFLFSEYVNDPMKSAEWEKVDENKIVTIYRKTIPGSEVLVTKTVSVLESDKETICKAITDINTRKSWDKVLKEYYMIEENSEKAIIYTRVNGVALIVSERETVQQRKMWKNYPDNDSICVHFKSVEHAKCPIKKKIVRAEVIIAGYYFKTISVNPPKTLFVSFDQFDFKGNVPKFIVNKYSIKVPKEWIGNLSTVCKKTM